MRTRRPTIRRVFFLLRGHAMRLRPLFVAIVLVPVLASALPGCTFVHMAPGASKVKVLATAPASCERRGEVAVSVKHRVGPYERSDIQVRDELETLARNEAPSAGANAVQASNQPVDGSQRFSAWQCPPR